MKKDTKTIVLSVISGVILIVGGFIFQSYTDGKVSQEKHNNEISTIKEQIDNVRAEVKEKNSNNNKRIDDINDLNRTDHKEIKEDVVVIKEDIAFIKGMLIRMNNRDITANK